MRQEGSTHVERQICTSSSFAEYIQKNPIGMRNGNGCQHEGWNMVAYLFDCEAVGCTTLPLYPSPSFRKACTSVIDDARLERLHQHKSTR